MNNNETLQYYENGMPYKPLYNGTLDGFQKDIGFKAISSLVTDNTNTPMVLVITITELIYSEIIEKYKKLNLQKYIISPDLTEIWLIFDHYYIRAAGITKDFHQPLVNGEVQCIVACKDQPIILPFELK